MLNESTWLLSKLSKLFKTLNRLSKFPIISQNSDHLSKLSIISGSLKTSMTIHFSVSRNFLYQIFLSSHVFSRSLLKLSKYQNSRNFLKIPNHLSKLRSFLKTLDRLWISQNFHDHSLPRLVISYTDSFELPRLESS